MSNDQLNDIPLPAHYEEVLREVREIISIIAKRPDLPNPHRDADWKNCQQWSSHDAMIALAKLDSLLGKEKA